MQRGFNTVVTARDPSRVGDFVGRNWDTALALPLDVTDNAQVSLAVQQAEACFGAIDVLNNAGYG